jgi:hypothetical protein
MFPNPVSPTAYLVDAQDSPTLLFLPEPPLELRPVPFELFGELALRCARFASFLCCPIIAIAPRQHVQKNSALVEENAIRVRHLPRIRVTFQILRSPGVLDHQLIAKIGAHIALKPGDRFVLSQAKLAALCAVSMLDTCKSTNLADWFLDGLTKFCLLLW